MLSQRLRPLGISDATPYPHAGYRCCAASALGHLYASFPNWRRGKTCAEDNNLYSVWDNDTIWKMPGQLCASIFTWLSLRLRRGHNGYLPRIPYSSSNPIYSQQNGVGEFGAFAFLLSGGLLRQFIENKGTAGGT